MVKTCVSTCISAVLRLHSFATLLVSILWAMAKNSKFRIFFLLFSLFMSMCVCMCVFFYSLFSVLLIGAIFWLWNKSGEEGEVFFQCLEMGGMEEKYSWNGFETVLISNSLEWFERNGSSLLLFSFEMTWIFRFLEFQDLRVSFPCAFRTCRLNPSRLQL